MAFKYDCESDSDRFHLKLQYYQIDPSLPTIIRLCEQPAGNHRRHSQHYSGEEVAAPDPLAQTSQGNLAFFRTNSGL